MNSKQLFEKHAPYYICLHIGKANADIPNHVEVRYSKDAQRRLANAECVFIGEHHSRKICDKIMREITIPGVEGGWRVVQEITEAQQAGPHTLVIAIDKLRADVKSRMDSFAATNGLVYENVFPEAKIMLVGTGHVTKADMDLLTGAQQRWSINVEPQRLVPNPLISFPYPEGAFVCVGEKTELGTEAQREYICELSNYGYSDSMIGIMVAAANTGYLFVRFDADEYTSDLVPHFEW